MAGRQAAATFVNNQSQKSFIFLHWQINQGSYSDVTTGIETEPGSRRWRRFTRDPLTHYRAVERSKVAGIRRSFSLWTWSGGGRLKLLGRECSSFNTWIFFLRKKKHFLHRLFLSFTGKMYVSPSVCFFKGFKNVLFELTWSLSIK